MREDLIERLRKLIDDRCGDGPSGPNYDPELLDVLTEAAAALEAAREDAKRLDWLDANGCAVRLKGNSRRNLIIWGAVHVPSYRTIRHSIDHARGEEEG